MNIFEEQKDLNTVAYRAAKTSLKLNKKQINEEVKAAAEKERKQKIKDIKAGMEHAVQAADINTLYTAIKTLDVEESKKEELLTMLNNKAEALEAELKENIETLKTQLEEEETKHYKEDVNVLRTLHEESEQRMYQMLATILTTRETERKRRVGNYVETSDRAAAIALLKIASYKEYSTYFTAHMIEKLNNKAISKAEEEYNTKQQKKVEKLKSDIALCLGKVGMLRMSNKLRNKNHSYYFNN